MRSEPGVPRAARARGWLLLLPALLAALGGCLQADTLGHKPPDTVTIAGTPTWDNGIAALMALKCAVCHQQPRLEIAPTNVPADLDLRQELANGTMRGADDISSQVIAGVLRQDLPHFPRMPLPHATPLVDDERTALETWANAVQPPNVSGATAAAGAVLYTRYCQDCHGLNGLGRFGPDIRGVSAGTINNAIAQSEAMVGWPGLSSLICPTCTQTQAIASYLAGAP